MPDNFNLSLKEVEELLESSEISGKNGEKRTITIRIAIIISHIFFDKIILFASNSKTSKIPNIPM